MKRVLIVLILFLSLSTFLTPFILADDRENNERNYFKEILDVLKDILAEAYRHHSEYYSQELSG